MNRGKIIQYDSQAGKGVVSVAGEQHGFTISQWRGDEAPNINRLVNVEIADGQMSQVKPVPESVLVQEKASELQKVIHERGKLVGGQAASVYGTPTLVSYATFVVATYVLSFVSINVFSANRSLTLSQAVTQLGIDGSGLAGPLFWLALLAPVLPFFLRQRQVWLTLAVPLLLVLFMLYSMWSQYQDHAERMRSINSAMDFFGGAEKKGGISFGDIFTMGIGFYAALAASAYMAWSGIIRYLTRG